MLEGGREKWDLFIDLEAISRQVAVEVDDRARDELVVLRPQDKVLGVPCFQGLEEESMQM